MSVSKLLLHREVSLLSRFSAFYHKSRVKETRKEERI